MMTSMNIEQLDLGDPRPPDDPGRGARVNPLLWLVLVLFAIVAGVLLVGRGTSEPPPVPPPTSARQVLPPAPGPDQRQYLGVSTICGPVTDGRRTLAVSFEVSNVSQSPVTIDTVTGVLPEGGLRQRGPATRGGNCEKPGRLAPAAVIDAGQREYYTLRFTLPRSCPARYPVQVRIGFGAAGFAETSLSILYTDLSVPEFTTCGR